MTCKEAVTLLLYLPRGLLSKRDKLQTRIKFLTVEDILLIEELRDLPLEPRELLGILLEDDLESLSSEDSILDKLGHYFLTCPSTKRCEILKASRSFRINKVLVKKADGIYLRNPEIKAKNVQEIEEIEKKKADLGFIFPNSTDYLGKYKT